jgi:hypothetical protein
MVNMRALPSCHADCAQSLVIGISKVGTLYTTLCNQPSLGARRTLPPLCADISLMPIQ